jgi:hypothetical protein
MRLGESNDLFDAGVGVSTCGDFTCGLCGTKYNQGNDEKEDYSGDSVPYTNFAGIDICYQCFEKVEREILSRMPAIIEWYCKILKTNERQIEKQIKQLKQIFLSIHEVDKQ